VCVLEIARLRKEARVLAWCDGGKEDSRRE
jgi:hypothetical protein